MIDRSIEWALRNRGFVVCATLLFVGLGFHALHRTPLDAVPDLSENQVVVLTEWEGRSAEDVEDQITFPLVTRLQGLTSVRTVRAAESLTAVPAVLLATTKYAVPLMASVAGSAV